jgi:hypothetical protein
MYLDGTSSGNSMLTKNNFEKAVDFIQTQARPLDIQLHNYHFNGGSVTAVLHELAAFQNEDGGFGHGIEPDFRSPVSSPMATSVALQYCLKVKAPSSHGMMQKALQYLQATFDAEHHYWPSTTLAVNDAPHAIWWHVSDLTPPDEAQWPNVSAELVGYVHHYQELVSPSFYEEVMARARQNLDNTETLSPLYNLLCWQRTAVLMPPSIQTKINQKIQVTFSQMQPITPETLAEIRVFWCADNPTAVLAQQYPETVSQLLAQEIANQAADGGWWPTWHWGQYEDVWPIAEKEWAGKITTEALYTFKNFGMLEEPGVSPHK